MTEQLPSWREGAARTAITDFVSRVCDHGSPDYVPPAERIAVFDNDGCLWSEKPFYFQGFFVFDRIATLSEANDDWSTTQPYKAVLEQDWKTLGEYGTKGLLELVMATHAGMTTDEFARIVDDWLANNRHPRFDRPYTEMVFQPMLELLAYLRANEFKTFIVSAGGIEFVRRFSERVYGVPPEQVIGSSIVTRYEVQGGTPTLVRAPELNFLDDQAGKPVGINQHIGRRPIAAFGNSDGDLQMLDWTMAGGGPRLGLLVHHDDADREFAYDRQSASGRLDKGLSQAPEKGYTVVSMKDDWAKVFAFEA